MAKKTEDNDAPEPGEQLDLIVTQPENAKKIQRIARAYKKAQRERMDALNEEIAQKEKLLAAIKEAEIVPDTDGNFAFTIGKMKIKVKHRDELVQVKDEEESED
jgi:hypothetical protein